MRVASASKLEGLPMAKTLGRLILAAALVGGCATAPKTHDERSQLEQEARDALQAMQAKDRSLGPLLDQAAGYIVFPEVKAGGFVVGGAGGRGVIFERGRIVGFAQMSQAAVGALIGGQKYAELIVVRDRFTLDKIKAGNFDFGAQASAVIVKAGAATATRFGENGVAVVVDPRGGAMVNLSLTGQRIKATM
jgi:lipid-binding SYLF domain-containing protein